VGLEGGLGGRQADQAVGTVVGRFKALAMVEAKGPSLGGGGTTVRQSWRRKRRREGEGKRVAASVGWWVAAEARAGQWTPWREVEDEQCITRKKQNFQAPGI